ncbi:MAG: IS1634 family transposase, partial [Rhodospirillaceae bacterium]|nr:IS1634 family transposase [Rhodospirillaceae bacterium]
WRRVGLPELIGEVIDAREFEFSVERALFALVAHRVCAPASKLHCHQRWLAEQARIAGCEGLDLQHLYRAMDVLEAHKDALEEGLYHRLADLLNLDVEVMFYDTTPLRFEVAMEDDGAAGLRRRGHSKNGRGDAPRVLVGLAVTREGFPVRHCVFPGDTVDATTLARVKRDLKGWLPGRCVFVGDAGMVSEDNLRTLARSGGRYIVCMPAHRGSEADKEVIGRRGRYREVAPNLKVKEVTVGDGERRRRYAVCFNPREAERRLAHRRQVLEELEAELATLSGLADGERHRHRVRGGRVRTPLFYLRKKPILVSMNRRTRI